MAIITADCVMWRTLRDADAIPDRPDVLEIGKANWYGDVPLSQLGADVAKYGSPDTQYPPKRLDAWTAAEWYYRAMLRNPTLTAIDLDPIAPGAEGFDLNYGLPFVGHDVWSGVRTDFDIIINTGTAEHVFDLRRVWQTMHDACRPGGLMVHSLPLWGWLDHGFVNYQPTFVADLVAANKYDVLAWLYSELKPSFVCRVSSPADIHALVHRFRQTGASAMMHVAYRKATDAPFAVPMQGVYSERATDQDVRGWQARR